MLAVTEQDCISSTVFAARKPFDHSAMAGEGGRASDVAASASGAALLQERDGSRCRRSRSGVIDTGSSILKAKGTTAAASKDLAKAAPDAERMKRKREKLLRKAEKLTLMDLGRLAMIKRSGAPVPSQWPPVDSAGDQNQAFSPTENAAAPSSPAAAPSSAASAGSPAPSATLETYSAVTHKVKVESSSSSGGDADGVADCGEDGANQ